MEPEKKTSGNERKSIVIVGAGMAGLTAARRLADQGFEVTVLEANASRYGGRIYSFQVPGENGKPVDLGAMWIHGGTNPRHPVAKLCLDYDIKTLPHDVLEPGYMLPFDDHGRVLSPSQALGAMCRLNQLLDEKKAKRQAPTVTDASLQTLCDELEKENPQFMNQDFVKYMAKNVLVCYNGALAQDLSAKFMDGLPGNAEECFDASTDSVIPSGYRTLLDRLISQGRPFSLQLDRKVERVSIDSSKDLVRIVCTDHNNHRYDYTADHVIIAVPLGVMKARCIHFDPGLPADHLGAIDRMGFGNQVKVLLVFEGEPFWPDAVSLVTVTKGTVSPCLMVNMRKINGLNGLVAKIHGHGANMADSMDDETVVQRVLEKLTTIVDPEELKMHRLKYTKVTRWRNDPLIRGTYSYGKIGMTMEDAFAVRQPISHYIFFAGEHTQFPEGEVGTVYGAYMSGQRVAEEVIRVNDARGRKDSRKHHYRTAQKYRSLQSRL